MGMVKGTIKALKRAESQPTRTDWNDYELSPTGLNDIGVHKSFSWIRPEHMEPKGDVAMPEIRSRLIDQFQRCESWLDRLKNGEGTLVLTTMSVNDIGKLDVYQYIYFLVLHAKRHLTQMEKNKM